jgi:ParB family chromosome partitioning protein
MSPTKVVNRRKKVAPRSTGLTPADMRRVDPALNTVAQDVEQAGGVAIGTYRDPFGGHGLLLAALPIDEVEPTPFQRDASEAHVKRLMTVIERVGRFLDPIVAVKSDDGYWTPNGNHRLQALRKLGVKSVTALIVPEPEIAFKILALNTEKAHNVREKSLECIRMLRALADERTSSTELDFEFELEQPAFLTLGVCYEERRQMSGGAYMPLLRRIDAFLERPIRDAVRERARRGKVMLRIDDSVKAIVQKLKERGFTSPYLTPFVIARLNPIRFSKSTTFDFDEVTERMRAAAAKFNVDRVKQDDIVRAGGTAAGGEDEG